MRLISLTVENFRCYSTPVSIRFGDLTALVGRNDVGKSSLMDALAIFFETEPADKDDACKSGDPKKMRITCKFDQFPDRLIVDSDFPTTLKDERLLNAEGKLVIRKTYDGSLSRPKLTTTEAIAEHPTSTGFHDLLTLKNSDLKKRAIELDVDLGNEIDKRKNSLIRRAIWTACPDLKEAEGACAPGFRRLQASLGGIAVLFAYLCSLQIRSCQH